MWCQRCITESWLENWAQTTLEDRDDKSEDSTASMNDWYLTFEENKNGVCKKGRERTGSIQLTSLPDERLILTEVWADRPV